MVEVAEAEYVSEGLEGGTGRARGECAVDFSAPRVVPIGGGDHAEDVPGGILDDYYGGVAEVGVFEFGGFLADDLLDVFLEGEVEAGADFPGGLGGAVQPGSGGALAEGAEIDFFRAGDGDGGGRVFAGDGEAVEDGFTAGFCVFGIAYGI